MESTLTGKRKESSVTAAAIAPRVTVLTMMLFFMVFIWFVSTPKESRRPKYTASHSIVEIALSYHFHLLILWN